MHRNNEMSGLISVTADSLTFKIADENYSNRSISSLDNAASTFLDCIHCINTQWIQANKLKEGSIIRLGTVCEVDVEAGASIPDAFLSNLTINASFRPNIGRVMFVSRDGSTGLLGYGSCIRGNSISAVQSLSSNMSSEIFAVGGDTFDQKGATKCKGWVIPLVEIRSSVVPSLADSEDPPTILNWPLVTLAINIVIPPDNDESGVLERQLSEIKEIICRIQWSFLRSLGTLCQVPPLVGEMKDTGMSEPDYLQAVESSIEEMKTGSLLKVVYALRRTGIMQCPVNPAALLLAVANGNRSDEGKRYTFLFAPDGFNEEVFICLTPEQLCRVDGLAITTEALAGTYPSKYIESGGVSTDDKTDREHGTVSQFIVEKLSTIGECIIKNKELLQMKDVAHFRQVISATSNDVEVSGISLIAWAARNLHPTPAVCGVPIKRAVESIAKVEKFDRGLYASYCGILGRDRGELLVGLRSAVVNRSTVHVFAGAGIVEGSVPSLEWKEIDLKMSQYVRVLTSMRRPAMGLEFPNATAAAAAVVIEEMLRQGVGAFCVCPGSRSTPFAVAIYRNTVARAMTQVLHDERAAGFYALGCARAGILCVVLVTSGTAVSNLLPAVSEAKESALPIVLLTADRPSEHRDIGEAQTIRQVGIFSGLVEFEKDFPPPCSEASKLSAYLMSSIISDVSFCIGEIAVRRGQRVHLNFQFRKSEIDPVVCDKAFAEEFLKKLHPKVTSWLSSVNVYTRHLSIDSFVIGSSSIISRMQRWFLTEWQCWSVVVVVGELHSIKDAIDLRWMCETLNIPCICDTMSMMTSASTSSSNGADCIFMGMDRLLNSSLLAEALTANTRIIFRVGGSMISTRTLDWISKMPQATVVRVREDGYEGGRHDSTWIADSYIHGSVAAFAKKLTREIISSMPRGGGRRTDQVCSALKILRLANNIHSSDLKSLLCGDENEKEFSEPHIAMVLQQESDEHAPVFLSSSMACRDFDGFAGLSNDSRVGTTRRVGCNRGANGIDGVISSAVGYSFGCSSKVHPVTVLIGDVATLHDVSGIAVAAGVSPGNIGHLSVLGGGRVGKIVCVNNSGGAIFSFLPAADHRDDFFSPYLDTPHNLDLSLIASALSGSSADVKCVRVTSTMELRAALRDESVFFIECFALPTHIENMTLHKMMSKQLASSLDGGLTDYTAKNIRWTLHSSSNESSDAKALPLIVFLHGWLGDQEDWADIVRRLQRNEADDMGVLQSGGIDILTVASGGDILSPSLFCRALRRVIREELKVERQLLLVGYSQGGRLLMHYKSLYPTDVHALLTMGASPGKPPSPDLEGAVLGMWERSKCDLVQNITGSRDKDTDFLRAWYSLPIFSHVATRLPYQFQVMLERRKNSAVSIDCSLRNMACTSVTADSVVDSLFVGSLDSKYCKLGQQAMEGGTCKKLTVVPSCGHIIALEAPIEILLTAISSHLTPQSVPGVRKSIKSVIREVIVTSFEVLLEDPLVVLTNGCKTIFPTRRGLRILCIMSAEGNEEGDISVGVGEVYEPVFAVYDRRPGMEGAKVTYESMTADTKDIASSLKGKLFEVANCCQSVADTQRTLLPVRAVAPVAYGFEQCLLHALARLTDISLVDCLGAFLGRPSLQRCSHVSINGFISIRDGKDAPSSSALPHRQVLKMKVGDVHGTSCRSDAERVNELVASAQRGTGWLRLDANQSWSHSQASQFAELLSPLAVSAIEYIEEPLKFGTGCLCGGSERRVAYEQLIAGSPKWQTISIALDETLSELIAEEAKEVLIGALAPSIGAAAKRSRMVIKPSLLSLSCAYLQDPLGDVTISCTFESGLALAFQVLIASFYGGASHGVHAKADMIKSDGSTRDFSALLEERGNGTCVQVSRAERLLDQYAQQFYQECCKH